MSRPPNTILVFKRLVNTYGPQLLELPEPEYAPTFAYATLRAASERAVVIPNSCQGVIPTGFAAHVPDGYHGIVELTPNLAMRGLMVLGGTLRLTPAHRMHIEVPVMSMSNKTETIEPGQPVATIRLEKRLPFRVEMFSEAAEVA